jgi:hypothetical protein
VAETVVDEVQTESSYRNVFESCCHPDDLELQSVCIFTDNHSAKPVPDIMSSSGLDWDSSPSSVDNNDAGSWLPIQSRKKQSKPTQQIPDSARKPSNLPYNKQFEKNTDNGRMASASHRPAKPIYVPVQKFTPQVKKTESAIPYKNIGTQASSTIIKSRLINIAATTISESSRAVKSTKISPSTKAGKETAKLSKDDTGIYDLMMFVRAPNLNSKAGLNAIKSVHSRDGKSDLGPQAIIKKPIEVNQEFVKHRFLQGKKKKKVFSKIKKRILMVGHFLSEIVLSLSTAFLEKTELSYFQMVLPSHFTL